MHSTRSHQEVGTLEMMLSKERNVPMVGVGLEATARLICGGHDGWVSVWSAPIKELVQRLEHHSKLWPYDCFSSDDLHLGDGLIQCIAVCLHTLLPVHFSDTI